MTYFDMSSLVGSAPPRDEVVSLADQGYNRLLELILGGKIAPGTPLQERNLAEWLAMSRTPLREALSRLEAEQFITRTHGRAPVVCAVCIENFVAILDMRRILEVETAGRAAGNLPASVATQLFEAIDKLVAIETPTPAQHWAVDNLVHETIADIAGNPLVATSVRDLRRRTRLFNTVRLPQRLVTGASEHRILVETIMTGDAQKARMLMGRHLDNVKDAIITYLLRTNCD